MIQSNAIELKIQSFLSKQTKLSKLTYLHSFNYLWFSLGYRFL